MSPDFEPERKFATKEDPDAVKMKVDLPEHPKDFRHNVIKGQLLAIFTQIISGKNVSHPFCPCSYFPLHNLIIMAVRGELFCGVDIKLPELLAEKLTQYLWSETVRAFNERRKQE